MSILRWNLRPILVSVDQGLLLEELQKRLTKGRIGNPSGFYRSLSGPPGAKTLKSQKTNSGNQSEFREMLRESPGLPAKPRHGITPLPSPPAFFVCLVVRLVVRHVVCLSLSLVIWSHGSGLPAEPT